MKCSPVMGASSLNILARNLSIGETYKMSNFVVYTFILAVFGYIHLFAVME
jgi:hypothetical protein